MRLVAFLLVLSVPFLSGCNNDRYELSKDASGKTVRLDKRTGEVAIVDGDRIRPLKDAAQLDAERTARLSKLGQLKQWDPTDIPQVGGRVLFSTLWRDGKMYYQFDVVSLKEAQAIHQWAMQPKPDLKHLPHYDGKKRDEELKKVVYHRPFTVRLVDDKGFEISSFEIVTMTRIVDDHDLIQSWQSKAHVPLGEDDYQRVASWTLNWR